MLYIAFYFLGVVAATSIIFIEMSANAIPKMDRSRKLAILGSWGIVFLTFVLGVKAHIWRK